MIGTYFGTYFDWSESVREGLGPEGWLLAATFAVPFNEWWFGGCTTARACYKARRWVLRRISECEEA